MHENHCQDDTTPVLSEFGTDIRANQAAIHRLRLSGIAILRNLTSHEIDCLATRCAWIEYDAGQLILNQDEKTNDVYFICSGSVKASIYSSIGHQVIYQTMAEGTMFGEIAAIDGAPRSVHVVADTSCLLAKLSAPDFIELMTTNPQFSLAVTRQIIDTTRFLTARVFEFSALNVGQRIDRELIRLIDEFAEHEQSELVLNNPPTHADIAGRVNTHREAVTKHLNMLSKEGVIVRRGRSLVVLDKNALKSRFAE